MRSLRRLKFRLASAALIGIVTSTERAVAQSTVMLNYGEVTVEVMGLQRWTVKMLQDSLQRYSPGLTLADAACMATLRYRLGFADASVSSYTGIDQANPRRKFVAVRLVEPHRRAIWRVLSESAYESLLPSYAPLVLSVTDANGEVLISRLLYGYQSADALGRERLLASAGRDARDDYSRVVAFLRDQDGNEARERAMRVIDSSAAPGNRMAAALVLMNFANLDATWYALARALRDPHEGVRRTAATVLQQFSRRRVDWAPVASDLRVLLGGANVSEIEETMGLLVATGIDPALASVLLARNGSWITNLLDSKTPMTASRTRTFLIALNRGVDRGPGASSWRPWIARL